MLFNSIDFAIFLPICFVIYWFLLNNNIKYQNLFIAFSSYIFYAWWDWRFLSLIFVSTVVDFYVAKKIYVAKDKIKKKLLILSLFINIGLLCFFKYYNFFLDNFVSAFSFFGFSFNAKSLSIILLFSCLILLYQLQGIFFYQQFFYLILFRYYQFL